MHQTEERTEKVGEEGWGFPGSPVVKTLHFDC